MFSRVNVGLAIRISVISRKRAGSANCVCWVLFDRPKLMCRRPFEFGLLDDLLLPVADGCVNTCLVFNVSEALGLRCDDDDDDGDGVDRVRFNCGICITLPLSMRSSRG